jgi:fatty-acyl-CoA synthase
MNAHLRYWPPGVSRHLTLPKTHLFHNVEVSAKRFPDKTFTVFYDSVLSFGEFHRQAEAIAGYLQQDCGVKAGDRVLLDMQNSPQWVLAYYAILRADAVVVPINPMNRTQELRHYVSDSGAAVAFVAQDLLDAMQPLLLDSEPEATRLHHLVVATYSDYLTQPTDLRVPDFVTEPRVTLAGDGLVAWMDVLAAARQPGPMCNGPDDMAVMPYTSGTTGHPKGCIHTHRSVMSTTVGGMHWFSRTQDSVMLSVLPFFHVTGMAGGMNGPMYIGGTLVVMPRWDRDAAAECVQRYQVTSWQAISTMVVDFLANPRIGEYDLSSLAGIRGGGAAMPEAVAVRLKALTGLEYVEGYGMSETMAATHINPPQRAKPQCLGIPVFDVDARVIDPDTHKEVPQGETGEIVVHGPQVMQGYWRQPDATRETFIEMDGKSFLRTGDLGRIDEDGYFFMTDRLKRMINASGFKVWPAEVEAIMYHHPAVQEACVIAARDPRRGETVKVFVVRRSGHETLDAPTLMAWCQTQMASYKVPRLIEFVATLPKSGTGKLMWRELQEQQAARDALVPGTSMV